MQIRKTQKKFVKIFEIKDLEEYHDFHVQNDTLLLADVFKNFRDMFLKIKYSILQNSFWLLH